MSLRRTVLSAFLGVSVVAVGLTANVGPASAAAYAGYAMAYFTESPSTTGANYGLHLAVSFRSVNYPTSYLRHATYALVLNTNDSTSQFAKDATFYKTSGFADSSWTSFRSYNYPDRYIRQSNYVLRIDPITNTSSAAVKQDATFRIGY